MPPNVVSTGVAITNPLVLYRALVSTGKIKADPAQHRLALHLQKLYERLKDYEPTAQYSQRLKQISRAVDSPSSAPSSASSRDAPTRPKPGASAWRALLAQKQQRDNLALTRTITDHEAALHMDSPQGLMLHGEVGTGKSMLIDLFADCLPNRKKRRWHFNTFMLETIARLEELRQMRVIAKMKGEVEAEGLAANEHSLLWLARDLIQTSPILFLDEFQLPDRAASKIMSSLMTSFFHLGGVLVATSNRMPEELAKAAGVEIRGPPSAMDSMKWRFGFGSKSAPAAYRETEFGAFLEVLRARCEVWEMEGKRDYRRIDLEKDEKTRTRTADDSAVEFSLDEVLDATEDTDSLVLGANTDGADDTLSDMHKYPPFYFVRPSTTEDEHALISWTADLTAAQLRSVNERKREVDSIPWTPSSLRIYGRTLIVPRAFRGVSSWTFSELCASRLGPADYITLASTYHTLILHDVPSLSLTQKEEARRFITLLDALYEVRCKLLVSAEAGPDNIFFPETKKAASTDSNDKAVNRRYAEDEDAIYAETFSEAYQDVTAPFRPNISSYATGDRLAPDALEDDPPNRIKRDLAGNKFDENELDANAARRGPDFGRAAAFTGDDERFAYKRARSRLWEMCGERWWARSGDDWWRPLDKSARRWEISRAEALRELGEAYVPPPAPTAGSLPHNDLLEQDGRREKLNRVDSEGTQGPRVLDDLDEEVFRHGASPFRNHPEPPPKFGWQHIWGTVRWGKKSGPWGKGVEGLEERKKEKEEQSPEK